MSDAAQGKRAGAGDSSPARREPWFVALRAKATKEPLGVDISDYSDEFCAGFLAGQVNALDAIEQAEPVYDHAHYAHDRLRQALSAYRSALRCGERESDQLRDLGDAALDISRAAVSQKEASDA